MTAAPLFLGAAKVTRNEPLATLETFSTVAAVGAPIVTDFVNTEAGPVAKPFSAATVNV